MPSAAGGLGNVSWNHGSRKREIDFEQVFGKPGASPDAVREYLSNIRDNWASAEGAISKSLAIFIAISTAFLLIQSNALGGVAISGITISKLPLVYVAIPVILSYLMFTITLNMGLSWRLQTIHDDLYEYSWRPFWGEDLELTLRPSNSFAVSELLRFSNRPGTLLKTMLGWLGPIRATTYLIGPLAFSIYALTQIWIRGKSSTVESSLATVLSAVFIVSCLPTLIFVVQQFRADYQD